MKTWRASLSVDATAQKGPVRWGEPVFIVTCQHLHSNRWGSVKKKRKKEILGLSSHWKEEWFSLKESVGDTNQVGVEVEGDGQVASVVLLGRPAVHQEVTHLVSLEVESIYKYSYTKLCTFADTEFVFK